MTVDFEQPDAAAALEELDPLQLAELPFGCVKIDLADRVLVFSARESALSGFDHARALGRNWFADIAPCMAAADFRTFLDRERQRGRLDIRVEHVGDFNDAHRAIEIRIVSGRPGTGEVWLLLRRAEAG